jgi:hypothetical protein
MPETTSGAGKLKLTAQTEESFSLVGISLQYISLPDPNPGTSNSECWHLAKPYPF